VSEHTDDHLELCAGYVLGSLDPSDRRRLEAHLAEGCPLCAGELARMEAGAGVLAGSVRPLRAPAALRGRVMAAIEAEPNARRRIVELPRERRPSRAPVFAAWGLAAAAALLLVAGLYERRTAEQLRRELLAARDQAARSARELEEERRWAEIPASPLAVAVDLAPTTAGAPDLRARVTYDPLSRRAVVVCTNFTAPAGKDYQLWGISSSGPASLGLVRADKSGRAVLHLENAGDPAALAAFAVSLENYGGAPTPTAPAGAVVMLGKIPG
jgi:anti-sigma-K factor RskA